MRGAEPARDRVRRGTVVDPDSRRRLRDNGKSGLAAGADRGPRGRVGNDPTRPLLAGDPAGALRGSRRSGKRRTPRRPMLRSTPRAATIDAVADAVLDAFAELAS